MTATATAKTTGRPSAPAGCASGGHGAGRHRRGQVIELRVWEPGFSPGDPNRWRRLAANPNGWGHER
jgi:hypothetical protein